MRNLILIVAMLLALPAMGQTNDVVYDIGQTIAGTTAHLAISCTQDYPDCSVWTGDEPDPFEINNTRNLNDNGNVVIKKMGDVSFVKVRGSHKAEYLRYAMDDQGIFLGFTSRLAYPIRGSNDNPEEGTTTGSSDNMLDFVLGHLLTRVNSGDHRHNLGQVSTRKELYRKLRDLDTSDWNSPEGEWTRAKTPIQPGASLLRQQRVTEFGKCVTELATEHFSTNSGVSARAVDEAVIGRAVLSIRNRDFFDANHFHHESPSLGIVNRGRAVTGTKKDECKKKAYDLLGGERIGDIDLLYNP